MTTRIGINGFGRIGRCILRQGILRDDLEFIGINDLTSPENLAYLFKYDSVHGRFDGDVSVDGDALVINGKRIPITAQRDPAQLDWGDKNVDIVHECTGFFSKREGSELHLKAGARYVLISAPAKGEDLTVVYGVNHTLFDPAKHKIVSNASCTTNCLAPMAKVLNDAFGIEKGLMTTIHAYTSTQAILDGPKSGDFRRGRAAAVSMIPTTTGAANAVSLVLPELAGRLDGMSIRVPTPNVSLTDLTVHLSTKVTVEQVNAVMKAASEGALKGVLEYGEEPLVSIDHMSTPPSCSFISDQTRVKGDLVKVLGWYDNEWGFSARMLDMSAYIGSKIS